jgi:hypothetical protein
VAKAAIKIQPWDPKGLAGVDPRTVEWSKGFLRCQPLKWFPDLDRDWKTFCLALGWEASVTKIEPSLTIPTFAQERLFASAQGEPMAVVMERNSAAQLGEMFMQSQSAPIRSVGAAYLARRLLARMSRSWVGGEPLSFRVDTELTALDSFFAASINFSLRINARSLDGAFLLGPRMVGLLDGLWRRQLRAGTKTDLTAGPLFLLAAELKVVPLELPNLLNPGTVIPLGKLATDPFYLARPTGSRIPVAVFAGTDGCFVLQAAGAQEGAPSLGAQYSRVSFVFGELAVDPFALAELHQVGAYLESTLPLGSEVTILVAGEHAGRAVLGVNGADRTLVATVV